MKIIKYSVLVLVVLLLALLITPYFFKGKIVGLIKNQMNSHLHAKVYFNDDVSLSLIKDFPSMYLNIKDLSVAGISEFEGDTLLSAKNFSISLNLMSVIKGEEMIIKKIRLDQPRIKALVLKNGKVNWDITKTDSNVANVSADTASSPFNVKLKSLEIVDAYIYYNDEAGNMTSELEHFNYTLSGDFSEKLFEMKNTVDIGSLTVGLEGINYLNKVRCTANALIDADMNQFAFTFKENVFTLNDLQFAFNGTFAMPGNDMRMDITYAAKQNEFKSFLSLIPALYANDFKDMQAKGKLAFSGHVKGIYNENQIPAFGLKLGIENGWFKYTALPIPVENVQMDLNIFNPDGNLDHTVIDLKMLHFDIAKDPFDARFIVKTPMSDPYIDAMAKGILNLNNMAKLAPLPADTKLKGIIRSDWNIKGNLSSIEKADYTRFTASGNLICEQLFYAAPDLPKPFELAVGNFGLSPKAILMRAFDAKIGGSDLQMEGEISNYLSYYFDKGSLKGRLNVGSTLFDANAFMAEENANAEQVATDTAQMAIVEVPANIEFVLSSRIDKLLYTNLKIENFIGNIEVKDQQLTFQNIAMKLLGSNMKMKGFYETRNPKKPTVDIDFSLVNLDIQQAFKTFNTVQKLAPAAEHVFGLFNADFTMQTALTSNMQPNFDILYVAGNLSIPYAELKDSKTLNMVSDFIQKPEYKTITMKNSAIAFIVEKGRINTKPFEVKLGNQTMKIGGSTGLDQTINYTGTLEVPREDLGAADKAMSDALNQLNQKSGIRVKMNETLPLQVNIGGTFSAPIITNNLAELVKSELGSLGGQLKDETLRMKQEALDKAKAEAEKLKNEGIRLKNDAEAKARAEADRIRKETEAKLRAESDKLKKEAEEKAKAEANKLKKQAEEEAKKRLKGLLK